MDELTGDEALQIAAAEKAAMRAERDDMEDGGEGEVAELDDMEDGGECEIVEVRDVVEVVVIEEEVRRYHHHRRQPQISLLVPFRSDPEAPHRTRVWEWLDEYWHYELPDAEIVVGQSHGAVFSKVEAIRHATERARGRILAVLDSDAYITGHTIRHAANEIDAALRRGHRRWYIPYRELYRLTEETTEQVLQSDPRDPMRFRHPPDGDQIGGTEGSWDDLPPIGAGHGHRYGALCQIFPREALEAIGGGWGDRRMVGWGGEDIAALRQMDTLYMRHRTLPEQVLHMWHARAGGDDFQTRMWYGQDKPMSNTNLASRYSRATGDRARMQALVDEQYEEEA